MVKAVVVAEQGSAPEVADVQLPPLGEQDVRLRIASAGVCHSDLSMINGTLTPEYPVVLGHEAAGTVAEVGSAVETLQPGQQVVVNWAAACRRCWFCLQGEPWLCSAAEGTVSTPSGTLADGTGVHACMGIGAFAEEVVLPARSVVPLPEGVPLDLAALMGCALLTGIGAVRNTAQVRPGQSVLVVGLGGIGLSAVLGARLAGAVPIVAVDVSPEKEALARAAGATDFLVGEPKLSKQVRRLTGGRGVDHALDCVGASTTIRQSWSSTRRGGQCTLVGIGKQTDEITFNPLELFHFARTLTSSVYGSGDPDRDVPQLAEQVRHGRLDLESLVTDRISLAGVPDAFARMEAGQGARSIIEFEDAAG